MTDAYFYVNIPYHRPVTPSPFRLLQRWAGPLMLGCVLAAIAWHQDHLSSSAAPAAPAEQATPTAYTLTGAASPLGDDVVPAPAQTAATPAASIARSGVQTTGTTHPSLVFHNCSLPHMDVKKDGNDMISGVATVSSCDEAKVTLWDSSR